MISDVTIERHLPPSFFGGIALSNDGNIITSCFRASGGVIRTPGIQTISPVVGKVWKSTTSSGQSGLSEETTSTVTGKLAELHGAVPDFDLSSVWLDSAVLGIDRKWINALDGVDTMDTDSLSDGLGFDVPTDMVSSPLRTYTAARSVLAILWTKLEVSIICPAAAESRQQTVSWKLSETIARLEKLSYDPGDDRVYVTSRTTLERLRLHSIDWSTNLGTLTKNNFAFSLLATGNEHGELCLWHLHPTSGPQQLAAILISESSWITLVKFSPPTADPSSPDNVTIYITAATSHNELYLLPVHVSNCSTEPTIQIDTPLLLCEKFSSAITHLHWCKGVNGILIALASSPRHTRIVGFKVNKHDARNLVSVKPDIFTPIVGARSNWINTDSAVCTELVSATGQTVTVRYDYESGTASIVDELEHPSLIAQQIAFKTRTYSSSTFAEISPSLIEMRVYGSAVDQFGIAACLYTLSPSDRLRYPIISNQSSHIAFAYDMDLTTFWDTVERSFGNGDLFSPRAVFWAAKLSAFNAKVSLENERKWIASSIEVVSRKLESCPSALSDENSLRRFYLYSYSPLWRRVLNILYSWSKSASTEDADAADIQQSQRQNLLAIRSEFAVAVLSHFLQMGKNGSEMDISSRRVLHYHSQFLSLAISICDGAPILWPETLTHYQQTIGSPNTDIGFICVACEGLIEIQFQANRGDEFCVGVCRKMGHRWAICPITFTPLMSLHQRKCNFCGGKAVAADFFAEESESFAAGVLRVCDTCLYCGNILQTM
ncbi:hypothetical protein BZA70DRAFT_285902 [Myxozyma melibiosi]|uniref:Transcription factor IIIC putative zinc-finger domain-containing protein n=1 Tax=Myxozyma melibiosi TaxID=54550 RepID=A0ABR1EY13_9ASCO